MEKIIESQGTTEDQTFFFLWRACQDCIPTQFRLLQRGIEINDVCVFCGSAGKIREHVLVTCPYACDLMSMFLLAGVGSGFKFDYHREFPTVVVLHSISFA